MKKNLKKQYFLLVLFFFTLTGLSAREYETDRGTIMVNCAGSYSGSKNKLYNYLTADRVTSMILIPSVDFFIIDNLFIGSAFSYSHYKNRSWEDNTFGAGPEIGYLFGKPGRRILPVISSGYLFTHITRNFPNSGYDPYGYASGYGGYGDQNTDGLYQRKASGRELFVSLGIILPVKSRFGLSISGIYRNQSYDPTLASKVSGNIIALKIGVNGLFFRKDSKT